MNSDSEEVLARAYAKRIGIEGRLVVPEKENG